MHYEDHGFEVDEEGDRMVDASKGRASNYTMPKDILLCNTWLSVSMDAAIATDQTTYTYWFRMKEHFDARNTTGIEHTNRSIQSRWSLINSDCMKWGSALLAVDRMNPSGSNDKDRVTPFLCFVALIILCITCLLV